MRGLEAGVIDPSFQDDNSPSDFAKQALYYIVNYGHFYCSADYTYKSTVDECAIILLVKSGSLYIKQNDICSQICAGSLVLVDKTIEYTIKSIEKCEFQWIRIAGSSTKKYCELLCSDDKIISCEDNIVCSMFEKVFAGIQDLAVNEHIMSSDLHRILGMLATLHQRHTVTPSLVPALEYIRTYFAEEISVMQLANQCSMSQSHFIRSFQKCFSHTPHEYLLEYRLRQAKMLLAHGGESVEQIAEMCGFNSASHFARAFRKYNGISPSEYRRSSL